MATTRSKSSKGWLGLVLGLAAVFVFLVILVQVLGRLTLFLSGTGSLTVQDLPQSPAKLAAELESIRFHTVAEWPAFKGRKFNQAPALSKLVQAGQLEPVAQRLPKNPLVIVPPDQTGPYGGTWTRFGISPGDVSQYRHRIAYESLLRWGPLGRRLLPNLAWRWSVEDQGRVFTFWLREGVRWSDGHPFSADDILFWHQKVLLNKELTPGVGPDLKRGGAVVKVEKVDQNTVRFIFKEPHGLFLQLMAGETGYDLVSFPAHYLKQFHPDYTPKATLEKQARQEGLDFWYK
ncbi:MAG: hypothetical protein JRJ59_05595, partial [Deltaproteobacteria bacterium]|nr:hypothetical protein [Deltaproteobacteria bacterium]